MLETYSNLVSLGEVAGSDSSEVTLVAVLSGLWISFCEVLFSPLGSKMAAAAPGPMLSKIYIYICFLKQERGIFLIHLPLPNKESLSPKPTGS